MRWTEVKTRCSPEQLFYSLILINLQSTSDTFLHVCLAGKTIHCNSQCVKGCNFLYSLLHLNLNSILRALPSQVIERLISSSSGFPDAFSLELHLTQGVFWSAKIGIDTSVYASTVPLLNVRVGAINHPIFPL